ncbi:unnamed protein product, partial [Rotaria sp. Silwood2]
LTRVVGQPSIGSLRDSPWNKVPILVFRNEVRTQLNNKAAVHKAAETGQAPMVCVSQDTCKGKPIEDPRLIKKLLELSDGKTEHLPGLLPLVPGMSVILTQNIAIELGLINGMNGICRQLVYEEDSVSTDVISETFPNNTRYIHKPLYAIIEIVRSKIECNFEQLQSNLVPIPLMEQTFRINIADVLPKDKKPKSNQKTILSIKRRALPLVPTYCITTHKSQGQTLNNVVIDLKLPNETDDIAAIYVPLSRVKRLADLIILRYFDYKILLMKPKPTLLEDVIFKPKHSIIKQIDKHFLPNLHITYDPRLYGKEISSDVVSDEPNIDYLTSIDGFGVGYYTGVSADFNSDNVSRPCVYKSIGPPLNDRNLISLCANTSSKCIFAHIRAGTGRTPTV